MDISKEITKKEREGSAFQHFNDRHGHIGELHLDKTNGATLHFRNRKVHTDASGRHKLIRIYFCAKMLSLNQWRCHWQRQLDSHKHTSTRPLDLRVKFLEECEDCAKLAEELKQYEHDLSLDNCGIISVGSWNLHSPEDCRKWAEERKQKFATKPVDAKDDAGGRYSTRGCGSPHRKKKTLILGSRTRFRADVQRSGSFASYQSHRSLSEGSAFERYDAR